MWRTWVRVLAYVSKSDCAQLASVGPASVGGVLLGDVLVLHATLVVRKCTCVHARVGLEFFCALWWWEWWCWGVAGTIAAWSRDKTILNCSNVLACVLLPCLL